MTLSFTTDHEYHLNDPTLFYCSDHNGLCITENYEDTLRITGVSDQAIIKFVNGLIEHHPELAAKFNWEASFKEANVKTTRNKKAQSPIKSVA